MIVTPFQIGIILTANYAFLNYLVLVLGFLLLDDRALARVAHSGCRAAERRRTARWRIGAARRSCSAWIFYATLVAFARVSRGPRPRRSGALRSRRSASPIAYGLFAVMTRARYEIEFQGTRDGATWIAYPFRYKPQDPRRGAGDLRALPAALRMEPLVRLARRLAADPLGGDAEARLLEGSPDVLALFRRDPFDGKPPGAGARRALAVLVHHARREEADRALVEAPAGGRLARVQRGPGWTAGGPGGVPWSAQARRNRDRDSRTAGTCRS